MNADLIRHHYQILTPENCMKPQSLQPTEGEWDFKNTDKFMKFARENGLEAVGHCLVWAKDDRTDEWMMKEKDGTPVSSGTLLKRIETQVGTVVGRYADVVTMWDVVNEAIGDSDDGLLRDSVYSRTTGVDFIVTAFRSARKHDPDALLIYNDYNGHKPGKREKLLTLLKQLKEKGAPIDAYGMQGHFELGDDSLSQLRETFDELRKLGLKVVVSELDIDVVTRGRWWADRGKHREELSTYNPYEGGLPEHLQAQLAKEYVALFTLFSDYSDLIERVSFWNLHDGVSWLNEFPWQRDNHPLLFDRHLQPKPCFDAVHAFLTSSVVPPDKAPPLAYDVEHTGADFAPPPLPDFDALESVGPLPDPFLWSDGSGRVATFDEWSRRRAEIKAEMEHYEIGKKPGRPEDISASYQDGQLTVEVTVGGETLELTSVISLPEGDGPFPAVIGIGFGGAPGSLPPDIFGDRKIAVVPFNFGQVMSHTQNRGKEPINKLYPDLVHMGAYAAWPWGVSRLIDGLELVQDDLPLDLDHLAITGCSFAGKMALFAGAFDERIALTIAQEPGGGGAAAWRVSETLGKVEKLGATSRQWFKEDMFRFSGSNVAKLPLDHHELMAMVAPRALLVLGNPDFEWLAEESGYVSCVAARRVWEAFGIADRMGFSIVPGHGHCQLPERQRPEVEAFVDKFLLGKSEADTDVTISPFGDVDHEQWTSWWGKGEAIFPEGSPTPMRSPIASEAQERTDGHSATLASKFDRSGGSLQPSGDFLYYIKPGAWTEYDGVDFPEGSNSIEMRVANGGDDSLIEVWIGERKAGTLTVDATGGWNNYGVRRLKLDVAQEGKHKVKLIFADGNVNINWFRIARPASEAQKLRPDTKPAPESATTPLPIWRGSDSGGYKPRVIHTTERLLRPSTSTLRRTRAHCSMSMYTHPFWCAYRF